MARKTNKQLMTATFSAAQQGQYMTLTREIESSQNHADGLAKTIAGALSVIKAKKLYEIDSYKNIYEYAEMRHGISRGTTSDAINVFNRFQDPDNKGKLLPQYDMFAWRALIMMKAIPIDEHIAMLGILPTMKSAEIKQRVQDYKQVCESLPTDIAWSYDTVLQLIKDAEAIETSGQELIEDKSPEPEPNYEMPENTTEPANKANLDGDIICKAQAMMGDERWEEFMVNESDDLVQACKDYVDEFTSFPKRTLTVPKDAEADKAFIKEVLALLEGVRNNEYDIIITA